MATQSSRARSQAGLPRRADRKPLKAWLAALLLVAVSLTVVDGQLAHNQVIPPGQKRPDLTSHTTAAAGTAATASKSRKQSATNKKHTQKQSSPTGKKIHPTYDRTQVYHGQHDSSVAQQLAPTTTWRPRPTHHSSSSGGSSPKDHAQQEPPKAFAYLDDIGIAPDVPFISGMRPAGQTWNDAGLRPNVDPRLKSPFRKGIDARRKTAKTKKTKANANHAHQSAFGAGDGKQDALLSDATSDDSQNEYAAPLAGQQQPKWKLRPEQPNAPSQSDDAEAAAVADEWAASEGSDVGSSTGQDRSTQATEKEVAASKAGTAAAAAAAAGYDTAPAIVKFKNNVLGSGKKVWKWIKTGGREKDGIALTMLQPKVHRPVVARLPMIPNDAKRDFVLLIIATIAGVSMLAFLWSSRVSPEDFQKAKRMKEYMAANPRLRSHGYNDYEDGVTAGASSSRLQPTGRRRNTASSATGRRLGSEDLGVASEESDSEVARAILSRNNTHRNRRISPHVSIDNQRGSATARLRSWLNFVPWSSKGARSDGSIALPLLSEFSRSATPRNADDRDDDRDLATGPASTGKKWSIPSISRSSSSTLLPSLGRSLTDMHGTGLGSSGASFLSKSPLRSVTPQPQTQRQRERERSRERRRRAEQARWEAEQARIRIGESVAGPSSLRRDSAAEGSSSGTPSGGELDDFEYFTRRVGYDDVDIDAIESGLPSRAASANSFRSWRGSGSERSAFAQGIAPFSSVKPLTPRDGTQQGPDSRHHLINADSPYGSVDLQLSGRTSSAHSHSHGASSSLSSSNSASSHSSHAGSSLLHVPDAGSHVPPSATDGSSPGWDSGGSTPRATSLRRPAKQVGSESVSAVDAMAGDETVTERGLGKQRAFP